MVNLLNKIYTLLLKLVGENADLNVKAELDASSSSITVEQLDASSLQVRSIPLDDEPGVTKTVSYYTGVAAGNPSGSTSNVSTIVYTEGGFTILTKAFTYNASNLILTIVNT